MCVRRSRTSRPACGWRGPGEAMLVLTPSKRGIPRRIGTGRSYENSKIRNEGWCSLSWKHCHPMAEDFGDALSRVSWSLPSHGIEISSDGSFRKRPLYRGASCDPPHRERFEPIRGGRTARPPRYDQTCPRGGSVHGKQRRGLHHASARRTRDLARLAVDVPLIPVLLHPHSEDAPVRSPP